MTALVIDLDPIRPKGLEKQATTEEELNWAITEAQHQRDLIAERGFVPPLLAMSGNGCQLWFFIPRYELPESGWYAARKDPKTGLEVFTHTFESQLKTFEAGIRRSLSETGKGKIKVDSIYDLPRIIKVMGTTSVKGNATKYPDRPHRVSRWLDDPIRREDAELLNHLLNITVESKTLHLTQKPNLPQVFLDALASDPKLRKLWQNPPRHGDTSARDWAIGITCLDHNIHDPQMLFDILSQKPHGKYRRDKYEPYLHMTISNLLTTLSQEEDTAPQFLLNFESSDSEKQKAKAEFVERESSVSGAEAKPSHSKNLTKQEKLEHFRSLFRGRTDVFAKRWEKWDGSKSGYSPACRNEWVAGICKKASGKKCSQCDYIPLGKEYTERHLRGQMTIGLYPLMKDNTSYFLAVDFDGADWKAQTKVFVKVCEKHSLAAYVERSRSGNGAHVWLFFTEPYSAYKSRAIAFSLLREAEIIDELTKADSFDRVFPNQDYLSGKGFGNLIALPLQHKPRQQDYSVFVDVRNDFTPYADQWEILATVRKITPTTLNALFENFTDAGKEDTFSETLALTVRNYVTIPKGNLPKKLTDFLTEHLHFLNSKFIINQRLGRSNYKTERYFKAIEHDDRSIFVPRGFLNQLTQFLEENEIDFQICDARGQLAEIDLSPTFKLFPHQKKALRSFEKMEDGILVAPPGSGKTIMGLELIARKKQPTLIIVHKKQIFDQWVERIEDFLDIPKKLIGQLSGAKKKVKTPITVAMVQSLSRREDLAELGAKFGTVLVDECHHVPAKMFRHVVTQLNPYYLFGLTATPQRKHNDEKLIFVYLGDIVHEVPKTYQHEDSLTEPTLTICIRETDFSVPFRIKTDEYHLLAKALIFDQRRNELIMTDISEYAQKGHKCLVLTERKDHVEMLNLYLKRDFEVITLTGDLGVRKRKEVEKQIHSGHFHILIATGQLIGEGTDLPNLDCLFLVYPFAFEGKLIQYIGRIERGKVSENARYIFDYRDSETPFLEKQFKKRNRYYKKLKHATISSK